MGFLMCNLGRSVGTRDKIALVDVFGTIAMPKY
jgi:hypothetical protein